MNRLIASSLALALLTGGAFAQAASTPPAGTPPAPMGTKAPAPQPGGPNTMNPGAPPPAGPGAMNDDGPGGPPPPDGPRGHRPPPPPKAAHYRIERGGTAIDVKCADDEPVKACADFTLQLLDKVQAMPSPAAPGSDVAKP